MPRKNTYFVADFENTVPRATYYEDGNFADLTEDDLDEFQDYYEGTCVPEEYGPDDLTPFELEFDTNVWGAALCRVGSDVTVEDVKLTPNLDLFMHEVQQLPGSPIVYFHNLAYDGPLLLSALLALGYDVVTPTPEDPFPNPQRGQVAATISENNVWYVVKVKFRRGGKTVEFRDSLKLLPFSVDVIAKQLGTKAQKLVGSIDYTKPRPFGYQFDETEAAYIRNDVLVMAEALAALETQAEDWGSSFVKSLTIGGACMKDYYRTLAKCDDPKAEKNGKINYRVLFPEIPAELDAAIRKSYHGGFCYVDPRHADQIIDRRGLEDQGHTYDVNSLYPSVMYRHEYPAGFPHPFTGEEFDDYADMPFIVRVDVMFHIKPDHIPFIQVKGSRWADNEYLTDSDGMLELTLTKPDYELLQEQYVIDYLDIKEGWWFTPVYNAFDTYIEKWSKIKKEAGETGNKVMRMIAKLMLNNLYGKLAQGLVRDSGRPYLDSEGVLRLEVVHGSSEGGYIPAGAYITAYARGVTIRAAQANYDRFHYADTDSIHLVGTATEIAVGEELGEWAHEAEWDLARFVRQKTYTERVTAVYKNGERIAKNPELDIKACGATPAVKTRLKYKVTEVDPDGTARFFQLRLDENDSIVNERRGDMEVLERFTYGLEEAGKLRRKRVAGGTVLEATTFRILTPAA